MKQPVKIITRLLVNAFENRRENLAWDLYVALYPNMTKETFILFEDFHNKWNMKVEDKSEEKILENVKQTIDTFNKSR